MGGRGLDKQAILDRLDFREFYGQYVELPRVQKREVQVVCPFHADTNPSLGINLETGLYNCYGCKEAGDVFTWVQKQHSLTFSDALKHLARYVGLMDMEGTPAPVVKRAPAPAKAQPKLHIDESTVERLHAALMGNPAKLRYLIDKRGLSVGTIVAYKIGWCADKKRYALPVYAEGKCANIRLYGPGMEPKIMSWAEGFGSVKLYPNDRVGGDSVVFCEGEWDCLLLRQNGFNAWTITGGAEGFCPYVAPPFRGKRVTLCYDCDDAGRDGAKRTAGLLHGTAKEIHIADLGLDSPEKADVTDWFTIHGKTADELMQVLENAPVYKNGSLHQCPRAFRDLVPPSSLLQLFVDWGSEITDAPTEFHLATGLATMSAILGNRVYFRAWGSQVFLNLWAVILAPSGFYRKSTCMRMATRMVSEVTPDNLLPSDFTQEKMVENFSKHAAGVIPVWEFGSLLKMLGKDYNSSLKEFLTEIYDSPHYVRDTKQGKFEIHSPALSILSGSTIDWLIANARSDDFRSGFYARFLFWPATNKNGWKGMGSQSEHGAVEPIRYTLTELAQLEGQATFSPAVTELYNEWLRGFENEVNTNRLPMELQGFYTRLGMYVLKFAVLYQLSQEQRLEVGATAMEYAIRLAEYLKSHLICLFEDDLVVTKEGRELKGVREMIEREPGIDRQTLLRKSKYTAGHLNALVETLVQAGEIHVEIVKTTGRQKMTYGPGGEKPVVKEGEGR